MQSSLSKKQSTQSTSVDLIHGNIVRSLLLFAIPIAISYVFQQLYNTMDTVIVGHFLGEEALAAIGAGSPLFDLLLEFSVGIGNGLAIVTARNYGEGELDRLKKSVATSIVIGIGTTIVVTLLGQFCAEPLLHLIHTPPELMAETQKYIQLITLFLGIMIAYNLCAALLRAIGNSFMPLVFLIFSSILNIGLDVLFIAKMGMGIEGAAIATVIAQGVSVVLCLVYIARYVKMLLPKKRHFRLEVTIFKDMLGLGLSMGFMACIVQCGTVILQSGINQMGALVIAGHTTARKIFIFSMIPLSALNSSMATFTSQNFGAKRCDRIREAMRDCIVFSALFAAITTFFMYFAGETLVRFVSGSTNEILLRNGCRYVYVMGPFYLPLGSLLCLRVSLQGLGKKVLPLLSSVIEMIGKILFTFFFIPIFQYNAVVLCEPLIWTAMVIELAIAFYGNPHIRAVKTTKKES